MKTQGSPPIGIAAQLSTTMGSGARPSLLARDLWLSLESEEHAAIFLAHEGRER